jgi:acetylornithine deacetylase/succinyl-diaminopimelate desuccinylase-like protein
MLLLAAGGRVALVSVGEKLVSSLRVRLFGTAGHASTPDEADNPLAHAATAIERLLAHRAPTRLAPAVAAVLGALGAPAGDDAELIAWAAGQHPMLGELLAASSRRTVTPTGTRTYEPANVIPPYADVVCDCRALPGEGEESIREHVAAALGDDLRYELELLEPLAGGTESAIDTALYRAIEDYVSDRAPGATLLPMVTPGFTDSHWIREGFGTVAYGFAPVLHGDPVAHGEAAHADDESIAIADLVEMAEFHLGAIRALT